MGLFDDMQSTSAEYSPDLIGGIVTGTVKENYNKDDPGKIKVELFLGEQGKNVTGWIPVMSPYAGSEFGRYELPEVGSEVVVAFNMGDRNRPVVLGCLWSAKNKLPTETATEKNMVKRFITKGKNELFIDDTQDKQKIEIKTANGKGVVFDEEKDCITVYDKDKKNSINIDSKKGEITVTADKKIVLNVGGSDAGIFDGSGKKITLTTGSVEIKANNDITEKGQNIKVEGTAVSIKGTSSLQAQSSGTTVVKGTLVKIN